MTHGSRLVQAESALLIAAAATAISAVALGVAAQNYWEPLSDATLELSRLLLSAATDNITYDPEQRLLGAGDFAVLVAKECSGYEGVALVLSFLAFFGYIFRAELRFPHFLLLAPIGVVVIWLSNSMRIAALTLLGAEVSPALAAGGFHSFAGLTLFLLVSVAMMLVALRMPFFRNPAAPAHQKARAAALTHAKAPTEDAQTRAARIRRADAMLLPFLIFLISGILLAVSFVLPERFYALRVVATGLVVAQFWSVYRGYDWRVSLDAVLAGVAVAALWIVAAPAEASENTQLLARWLAETSTLESVIWLLTRAIGFIIMVPLIEELVFRGYLHRVIQNGSFDDAPEAAFSIRAFVVTSILFGALHGRVWEGIIAGALFAIALYRSGRLSGAIYAHAVANGLIFIYVLATGHWAAL